MVLPNEVNIRSIMDLINKRRREKGYEPVFDPNESRMEEIAGAKLKPRGAEHDFEESAFDDTMIFDMKELEREEDRIQGMTGEIRSKGIIQFILLQSNQALTDWILPEEQIFHDFVNRLECRFIKEKMKIGSVLKWTNLWGSVGLMGLSAKDKALLTDLRDYISYAEIIPGKHFTTVPKLSLIHI